MKYNVILLSLATLFFSVFLSVVPSYANVEVGVDVPPNPTDISFDDRCEYVYGSTIYDGSKYYASYVASNEDTTIYGSFINIAGVNKLFRSYVYIPITDNSYLWQNFAVGYTNANNFTSVAWGSVRDSSYQYKTIVNIDGVQYLSINTNTLLPNDISLSEVEFFNDSVQLLENEWSSYSETDIFNLCKDFDHPQLIGEYDASIPCLIRADVSFSNVTLAETDVPLVQTGHVEGFVSPLTNKGVLTSEYVVDYQVFFGYLTCKNTPFYGHVQQLDSDFYSFWKYNGGLDLSIFNDTVEAWTRDKWLPFPSAMVRVSCNTISINARLRRKSDGNYGDWYSIGVNNLGFNPDSYSVTGSDYIPKSTGYSGIVSGATQTLTPTADFDDLLTTQNAPSTSIIANDSSLGTSESGGVLQQGGIVDLITATGDTNYDNILDALGDVPQLLGTVFGFFPPYVLAFIGTAFILLVSIGIVKILI